MAVIDKKKLLEAYKAIDLYRAKYRHEDLTPYGWCFHGNEEQEWNSRCANRRLVVKGQVTLTKNINADTHKHISFYMEFPSRIEGYSCNIYLKYKNSSKVIYAPNKTKLVYFDMTSEAEWTGTISSLTIELKTISPEGVEVETPLTTGLLEYFKVDNINVFEMLKANKTAVANDINYLRGVAESLNKGYYNTPCALGDVPNYSVTEGPCGHSDIVKIGRAPVQTVSRDPGCPEYIDWGSSGTQDDIINAFMDKVKKADFSSIAKTVLTLPPYNGCATCDLHQCGCYAVHYGRVECQACDGCNLHTPCTVGCDVGCYQQSKSCTCDGGCYTQPKPSCTCNATCYGYSSCRCNMTCYSQN